MCYARFLKLSLLTVFLGTSLSTASWAMEDEGTRHFPAKLGHNQEQSPLGGSVETDSRQAHVVSKKDKECLRDLVKVFPYSYYISQGIKDDIAYFEYLKKTPPYSYYMQNALLSPFLRDV